MTILCHCRLTGTSLCAYSCGPWETRSCVLLLPPLAVGPCLLHSWVDLVPVVSQASHWCSWPGVLLLEFSAGWSLAGWEAVLSWRPLWALSSLSYEVGLGKYGWCFFTGRVLYSWGGHVSSTFCALGLTQLFLHRERLQDSSTVFFECIWKNIQNKNLCQPNMQINVLCQSKGFSLVGDCGLWFGGGIDYLLTLCEQSYMVALGAHGW